MYVCMYVCVESSLFIEEYCISAIFNSMPKIKAFQINKNNGQWLPGTKLGFTMESWGYGEPIMLLLYSFSSSWRWVSLALFAVESGGASEHEHILR